MRTSVLFLEEQCRVADLSLGNPALDYTLNGRSPEPPRCPRRRRRRRCGRFFFAQGEPIVRHYFALLIPSRLSERHVVRLLEAERVPRELTPRRRKFAASRLTAGEKATRYIETRGFPAGIFKDTARIDGGD